jgi:cytochrome oxidase Cu insertion factor (SCO1/SenC/PrrC family)
MALGWRALLARTLLAGLLLAGGSAHALGGLWQLPDEFVDEYGVQARLSRWAGAQTIVAMEYSACKFVCSTNWRRLQDIQSEADRRKIALRFLIISLDPAHDSPSAWRDYRKLRGLQRDNWSFVTGSRAATDRVVASLGVKWWTFDDAILHDFLVTRLDAQGRRVAVMNNYNAPASALLEP